MHNWIKYVILAASYHVSDYKQRRVILDHIRSLLASPDRSGLVAPTVDNYAEKDLICEFITESYFTNLMLSQPVHYGYLLSNANIIKCSKWKTDGIYAERTQTRKCHVTKDCWIMHIFTLQTEIATLRLSLHIVYCFHTDLKVSADLYTLHSVDQQSEKRRNFKTKKQMSWSKAWLQFKD